IFVVPVMSLAVSPRLRDAGSAQEQVVSTWYLAARPLRCCYPECPDLSGKGQILNTKYIPLRSFASFAVASTLFGDNSNPCLVCRVNDLIAIQKQAFAGIDGQ